MKNFGWTIAIFLGMSLGAIVHAQRPLSPQKYVLNGSDCDTNAMVNCTNCAATILPPAGACTGGVCASISCGGGSSLYKACFIDSTTQGPCPAGNTVARACTGCFIFTGGGTPICLTGGTCSPPSCMGMGLSLGSGGATISPC